MSGGGTGTSKSQLDLNNKNTADQLAQQKAIRDQIMSATSQYTTGAGQGYDPSQFAAMMSQFLNNNSSTYNQAGSAVTSALAARGAGNGQLPVGGDYTQGLEALQGARASSQSQGILSGNISNLQQALTNKFNALNVQSGQSAQVGSNISTFNNGANNSLDEYVKASASSPLNTLLGSFGGALGKGLAAGATGGLSNAFSSFGSGSSGPSNQDFASGAMAG